MIDRQQFNDMFGQLDKENVVEIIDLFLNSFEERFTLIRKHVEERDFEVLKESAHKLKGAFLLFMDPITIELSKKLVEMARSKTVTGLDHVFAELEKNGLLLVEELKKLRKEFAA